VDLTQIRVGFPILQLKTRVYHATPRSPTAFERALLGICDRFGKDATCNNIPIERIFVDIMGVADPSPVLSPTIQELVSMDVLRCQGDAESLDILILRDLEITERGRQMLAEDMLPAKSQENDEVFLYDSVRKRLLSTSEAKSFRAQSPALALDASVFEEVFPEQEIRTQILAGEYSWWNSSSRIERIERQSVSMLWRETAATVTVEESVLRFSFKDTEQTNYVASLTVEDVQRRILAPTFNVDRALDERVAAFPLSELDGAGSADARWMPLSSALRDFPGNARLWLLDVAAAYVARPKEANSHQVIICFDPSRDTDAIQVTWNEARDGCLVDVKEAFPLDDVLIASNEGVVRGRRVRVKVGQEVVDLPMALYQSASIDNPGIVSSLSHIAVLLREGGMEDDALVPALWQPQVQFWREIVAQSEARALRLMEKLSTLQQIRKRFVELAGPLLPEAWDNVVADVVCDALKSDIELDEAEDLINAIGQCRLTSSATVERTMQSVTERLPLPASIADFSRITTAIKKGCPTWRIPFPSRLYTLDVLAAIARDFPDPVLLETFSNDNAFENGLRELLQATIALNGSIGGKGLMGLATEEDCLALLKSTNATRISEQSEGWRHLYDAFVSRHSELQSHVPGSALAQMNDRIEKVITLTRKLIGGLDPRFRAVFVLDTSALLERPEIMKSFRADDYVVVSKRVIEELDDKKREESLRPKVAEATRALQAFPRHQIQFCDGDMSLLAPDYRMKGDNLILSVAVRYRRQRPVLLTNDRNLTLKAKAEDINAMSVDEFQRRPRRSTSAQSPAQSGRAVHRSHKPRRHP
jgi:rRNA-processing protein FCF1